MSIRSGLVFVWQMTFEIHPIIKQPGNIDHAHTSHSIDEELFAACCDPWNRLTESNLQSLCHTDWISTQN